MTDMTDIDEISNQMNTVYLDDQNNDMIEYFTMLNIDQNIKKTILNLIYNDNYNDYLSIYNICVENNIEIPPS